jgi:hypothetical protein
MKKAEKDAASKPEEVIADAEAPQLKAFQVTIVGDGVKLDRAPGTTNIEILGIVRAGLSAMVKQ